MHEVNTCSRNEGEYDLLSPFSNFLKKMACKHFLLLFYFYTHMIRKVKQPVQDFTAKGG